MRVRVTLDQAGQIMIPKQIIAALQLAPGDALKKIVNWPSIIATCLSSLMGSLLAIFATPVLQHHFLEASAASRIADQDH